MRNERTFSAQSLEDFATRILRAVDTDADVAHEVARHLVRANMSGHDSHGVIRIPQYLGQIERGELLPCSRPSIARESATTLVVDAHRGFGHFSTRFALDHVAAKARQHDTASAAIRHATHVGRLGEYTERCAELGLVLIMTVGMAGPGVGGMVIHGGRERFFGANVWSIGVPGLTAPMVFDASMSSISVGKVYIAQAEGALLPDGCLVDRDGTPTTDPADYSAGGAVIPMGGKIAAHKGYGLALASALLGGLSMIDDDDPSLAGAPVRPGADPKGRMAGVFMIAINPEAYGGAKVYRSLVEACLTAAKQVPPAPGFDGVRLPGENASAARARAARDGIVLPETTCRDLETVARRFNVAMPDAAPYARAGTG